jgi:hypothetical protein
MEKVEAQECVASTRDSDDGGIPMYGLGMVGEWHDECVLEGSHGRERIITGRYPITDRPF